MTDNSSGRDNFLKFLRTSEDEYQELAQEAQPIVDYVESRIGGKDYWQVSYDELRSIYASVRLFRPAKVMESGVGPGTSTTAILRALENTDGRLISFDLGQRFGKDEEMPVGAVIPEELKKKWTLILGDSKHTLPDNIEKYAPVDVFFHDSEHTYDHVMLELEMFIRYASERFLIIVDNFDWSDAPKDFSKKYGLELYHVGGDMCYIFKSAE